MKSNLALALILSSFSIASADSLELRISSKPADAHVFINGKSAGQTPLNLKDFAAGGYLIRVEKAGHKTWKKAVQLTGTSSLEIKLDPLPIGTVTFKATPVIGEVVIDGRPRGETPLELKLSAGTHRIEIEAEGYITSEQTIQVKPGKSGEIAVVLKSRAESFLVARLDESPWRVGYAYELAHHYLVKGNGPKALETLERGLRAAVDYRAPTGEAGRLAQEVGSFYSGQFRFDSSQFPDGIQAEILKMLKRVAAEQPRNIYAIRSHAAYLSAEDALEIYKKTIAALKSERTKRYFKYLASYKAYPIASKVLTQAHATRTQWAALLKTSQTSKKKADIDAAAAKKVEVDKAYAAAVKALEEVISIYPEGGYASSAYTTLISIYQSYQPDPPKYAAVIHRYAEAFPESAFTYRQQLGTFWYGRKEHQKAIQEYRSILKDYAGRDECSSVHSQIVTCLTALKKDADAAREYEAMLRLYRQESVQISSIGMLIPLYEKLGNKKRADELRTKLVNDYSHTPSAANYDKDPQRQADRVESQKLINATQANQTALAKKKSELSVARAALAKLEKARKAKKAEEEKKAKEAEQAKKEEDAKKADQLKEKPEDEQSRKIKSKKEKARKKKKKKKKRKGEEEPKSEEDLKIETAKKAIDELEQELITAAAYLIGRLRPITLRYRKFSTARTAQKAIITIAQAYLSHEDFIDAMRDYIELFPNDIYCLSYQTQIAQQYSSKKMNEDAIREYRKYLKDYPESTQCPHIYYTLIGLMLDKNDLSRRAAWAAEIDEFIKQYPENSYAASLLYSRAMVYYYRSFAGDEELCVETFQLFEKMFPNNNNALSCERYRSFIDDGMQAVESRIEPQLKIEKWGAE